MVSRGHAEVNGLGGWLLFESEFIQTDVDETICQSDVLGVMVTTDMPSNWIGVIIGVLLWRILCFQRLELGTYAMQPLSIEFGPVDWAVVW